MFLFIFNFSIKISIKVCIITGNNCLESYWTQLDSWVMIFDEDISSNWREHSQHPTPPEIPIRRSELHLHGNKLRLPILSFHQMHRSDPATNYIAQQLERRLPAHGKVQVRGVSENNEKITIRSRITITKNKTDLKLYLISPVHQQSYPAVWWGKPREEFYENLWSFSEILLINGKF